MLLNTEIAIAYKCSSCGNFEFFNTSMFWLSSREQHQFCCRCGKSTITVLNKYQRSFILEIPCIGCGGSHVFTLERHHLISRDINVFSCPVTGINQCFIGNGEIVRSRVDKLEKELDDLISMFGFDSYFTNTQVMMDTLNRIHDIAERGDLRCKCGSSDIELMLHPDRISMRCQKCHGTCSIFAASNEDLKEILLKQEIVLDPLNRVKGGPCTGKQGPFFRRTDEK